MPSAKTVAVSFRVSTHFKRLLEAAAARERRSQTNMLETLLYDFCEQQRITAADKEEATPRRASKGGGTK